MKKIVTLVFCLLMMIAMVGCTDETTKYTTEIRDTKMIAEIGSHGTYIYVYAFTDPETNVQYIISVGNGNRTAICPRYDADGTLYTEKE